MNRNGVLVANIHTLQKGIGCRPLASRTARGRRWRGRVGRSVSGLLGSSFVVVGSSWQAPRGANVGTGKGGCTPANHRSLQDWSSRGFVGVSLPSLRPARKVARRRGRGRPGKCAFLLAFFHRLGRQAAGERACKAMTKTAKEQEGEGARTAEPTKYTNSKKGQAPREPVLYVAAVVEGRIPRMASR